MIEFRSKEEAIRYRETIAYKDLAYNFCRLTKELENQKMGLIALAKQQIDIVNAALQKYPINMGSMYSTFGKYSADSFDVQFDDGDGKIYIHFFDGDSPFERYGYIPLLLTEMTVAEFRQEVESGIKARFEVQEIERQQDADVCKLRITQQQELQKFRAANIGADITEIV